MEFSEYEKKNISMTFYSKYACRSTISKKHIAIQKCAITAIHKNSPQYTKNLNPFDKYQDRV